MYTWSVLFPCPNSWRVKIILAVSRGPIGWFALNGVFPVLSNQAAWLVTRVVCPPLVADRFVTTLVAHLRAILFVTLIVTVTGAPSSGSPGVTLSVVPSTRRSAWSNGLIWTVTFRVMLP